MAGRKIFASFDIFDIFEIIDIIDIIEIAGNSGSSGNSGAPGPPPPLPGAPAVLKKWPLHGWGVGRCVKSVSKVCQVEQNGGVGEEG